MGRKIGMRKRESTRARKLIRQSQQKSRESKSRTEFMEAHDKLFFLVHEAKKAFKAFIVFYNKGESTLAKKRHEKFKGNLEELIEFWRGNPMAHTMKEFYDIKPLHLFNGFEDPDVPEFGTLWGKYIKGCCSIRCQLLFISHEFPGLPH